MKNYNAFFLIFFFVSCFSADQKVLGDSGKITLKEGSSEKSFSFLTFNVENLFDTTDDPRVFDSEFKPLSQKKNSKHEAECRKGSNKRKHIWACLNLDWSESEYRAKLKKVSEVILSSNGGKGADVILLQEVENKGVVTDLLKNSLTRHGYSMVAINSTGGYRGVDLSILMKGNYSPKLKLHKVYFESKKVNFSKKKKRRKKRYSRKRLNNMLQITFQLHGQKVHVFNLHLPAGYRPIEQRVSYMQSFADLAKKIPSSEIVIAGGDFNLNHKDWEKNKINKILGSSFKRLASQDYCSTCKGSYYLSYKKLWTDIDFFLLRSKNELALQKLETVVNFDYQKEAFSGKPRAWESAQKGGLSDHFPVFMKLAF